jgi:hypothetical protein
MQTVLFLRPINSIIHDAVLQACDALDGVRDGGDRESSDVASSITSNLHARRKTARTASLKDKIESAKAMTSVLKDPNTGRLLFEGHLMPGIRTRMGKHSPALNRSGLSTSGMRNVVFRDRTWDYHTMNLATDVGSRGKLR